MTLYGSSESQAPKKPAPIVPDKGAAPLIPLEVRHFQHRQQVRQEFSHVFRWQVLNLAFQFRIAEGQIILPPAVG